MQFCGKWLRSVLERESDLEIVGEASSLAEALAVVDKVGPDIVLMDLKLSASSGLRGTDPVWPAVLGASRPRTCWFSPRFSTINWWCERCTRGARGYVVKDVDTTELVRAIRAVSRGESAFDSRSASAVVRSAQRAVVVERTIDRSRTRSAQTPRKRLVQHQDR